MSWFHQRLVHPLTGGMDQIETLNHVTVVACHYDISAGDVNPKVMIELPESRL